MKTKLVKYKIIKKVLIVLVITMFLCSFKEISFGAISSNFKFVIDTVGIPRYNALNEEISEEVYYTYNVFAYSNPVALVRQRKRSKMV